MIFQLLPLQFTDLTDKTIGIAKNPGAGNTAITRFSTIISAVIGTLTVFAGLAFLIYFIIGALTWTASGGQAEQLSKAKSQMGTAIVGLIVVILTIPITYIVSKLTGLDILNPLTIIPRLLPN